MKIRPVNYKIPDIKAIRSLTSFLGKLHIPSCYARWEELEHHYDLNNVLTGSTKVLREGYGFGIAESKNFVERLFDYSGDPVSGGVPWPFPAPRKN